LNNVAGQYMMEKNQETKKENSDFQESVPSQTGRVLSHPLALQVR